MTTEEIALQVAKKWQMAFGGVELDFALEVAKRAVESEREACAVLCSEVGQQPSSLWHEHGCWTHAAQVCAESIALRSNAELTERRAGAAQNNPGA